MMNRRDYGIDNRRLSRRKKRQVHIFAALCMGGGLVQYLSLSGYFDRTFPSTRTVSRMLKSYFLADPRTEADDEYRVLSKNLGGGNCVWEAPKKLNATFDPPRTLLVSYPGSGKRLAWRMIEAMTGYVTGDDWDLSEEGQNVATMKSSYPHSEGVWSWGDRFKDAVIVMLVRNPRWAIPSYQTIKHELGYSDSWAKSYVRRSNTYTERPEIAEWEHWRGDTWPNKFKLGSAEREIDMWAWHIDFWMRDGLRSVDYEGHPVQDYHCRNTTQHMKHCRPRVVIAFEKLYDPVAGPAEAQKLADALENGRSGMPIIENEARECVFEKTNAMRNQEMNWDNSARDGHGPDVKEKKFTWLHLQQMKSVLERLIADYSVAPWATNPVAIDLVSNLEVYLAEVNAEIDVTSPYTWWPTPSPREYTTPAPTPIPTTVQTSNPTLVPTTLATFQPTTKPTLSSVESSANATQT